MSFTAIEPFLKKAHRKLISIQAINMLYRNLYLFSGYKKLSLFSRQSDFMERKNMVEYYEKINHKITNVSLWGIENSSGKIIVTLIELFDHNKTDLKKMIFNRQLNEIASKIRGFLDGKSLDLSKIPLCMDSFSNFERDILKAARSIPFGKTVSYSDLAAMAGYPKAVRAVASVMRKNRFPLVIPCHRVIRKNGHWGGFHGEQYGDAVELKKRLIEMEKTKRNCPDLF